MADDTYPLFSTFAFLGIIFSLIPLPWHLQAWNSGTCYYMMWAALACLNQFVNSLVWAGNVVNHSPAWCEISIRIMMAASVGLPASSLCINRRLYQIANVRSTRLGYAEKSRAILIDTLICVLFPLMYVALQYVVQGHRFDIFEDIGCYPALYNTLLTYFISCMWPIIIGVISATYCTLSLRAFVRRRLEFSQFMHSGSTSLTMGRYFRLMALAMSDILLTTPLSIFIIYLNATVSPVGPWVSWEDTHYDYSRIRQIPSFLWRTNYTLLISMEFTRWIAPLCAFIFFAFFGFADEARKNYAKVFFWLVRPLGFKQIRQHHPIKDTESTGQFTKPKTPTSATYPRTSILPTFSPPSFHPGLDIKPMTIPTSTTEKEVPSKLESSFSKDVYSLSTEPDPTSPTTIVASTVVEDEFSSHPASSSQRFSWKTISDIPFSDRRHSSFF